MMFITFYQSYVGRKYSLVKHKFQMQYIIYNKTIKKILKKPLGPKFSKAFITNVEMNISHTYYLIERLLKEYRVS